MKSTVGETLRKCRIAAGKSVREMSELLTANGFKASEKDNLQLGERQQPAHP